MACPSLILQTRVLPLEGGVISLAARDDYKLFPLLTTSTGARRATPSRLGGFTSKSNKCTTKIDEAQQVLKVRIALICSQALSHTAPTLNYALSTILSQRESWGEALQRLGRSGASAARPEAVGWVYILIPLKLAVRIRKLAVVTVQGRHCRPSWAALPPL